MPSPPPGPVAGVVLAAGASRRMGRNKLLLEVDGEPLVRGVVRCALEAGLAPVIVVVGHEAEDVLAAIAGLACSAIRNPEHARGQSTSLRAGIAAVPPSCPAAVVLLADMPRVTADMIRAVVARHASSHAVLVASDYAGVAAPPTLYDRRLFGDIAALAGDSGGRSIVEGHRAEAQVLTWPAERLADLDVPEDVSALRGEAADVPG